MTVLGDVVDRGVVADPSGTDFPCKRFEETKLERDAVVPFTCPFDNCETSE